MSLLAFNSQPIVDLVAAMALSVVVPSAVAAQMVHAVSDDSREIAAGMIFVARQGVAHDASDFIAKALDAGAAWVLSEQAHPDERVSRVADLPSALLALVRAGTGLDVADLHLIGITGTNGKTSVAQFIASTLTASGAPHTAKIGLIGTLGAGVWTPDLAQLQPTHNTTPGLLATLVHCVAFLRAGVRYVVMEVSSHALAQDRLRGLPIRDAVFTNLSHDHLDYHGDMVTYLDAKARLFAWPGLQTAMINFDSPYADDLFEQLGTEVDCWVYGLGEPDWRVADCHQIMLKKLIPHQRGFTANMATPMGEVTLSPALIGLFNTANLMAALATVLALGMPLDVAAPALNQVAPPPGRMQLLALPNGAMAVIDYAHTPDALDQVLRALRDHRVGDAQILCVFGCGGDRDRGKRPLMAAVAERSADTVILTSDNPRSEAPQAIVADMLAGIREPGRIRIELDRQQAIAMALAATKLGDWVLIAGKGHETTQEIQGQVLPFSDVVEVHAWCARHALGGAA
ncbi:MAG: UDP-N-acetylmuramoyl-L-alanyl-D-glutamate--2,6-diaminopimelate ligase [Halothiobacillus sp.]